MPRQFIRLTNEKDSAEQRIVRAVVRGALAIHRTWTKTGAASSFTLTHVPSGWAIDHGWRKAIYAKRELRLLAHLDWDRSAEEIKNDPTMREAVREASQLIERD